MSHSENVYVVGVESDSHTDGEECEPRKHQEKSGGPAGQSEFVLIFY